MLKLGKAITFICCAGIAAGVVALSDSDTPATHSVGSASGGSIATYDAGYGRWLNAPNTVELSHTVTFAHDDAFMKTDAAVVQLDSQGNALSARSLGPVHLYDPQDDLTGQHGSIDFPRHVATLTDQVILTVKPGPAEKNAPPGSLRRRFTDPATLTCEIMNYNYRDKVADVPDSLTVTQKDRVLTADTGRYNAQTQTIVLTGHVHGHDQDDVIDAPTVTMVIAQGAESITIPAPVHGRFKVRDQTDKTADVPSNSVPSPASASTITPAPSGSTSTAAPGPPITTTGGQ